MRKRSPATIIALLALFVSLGGVGIAATGGNFILGQPNSATSITNLSGPVPDGKTLQLTNSDATKPSSTALGLTVASGHAPFTVSSKTKVANLDADLLDGLDSTGFLRPGAVAGGDLSGTYPAPTIGNGKVTAAKLAALPAVRATNPVDFLASFNNGTYNCYTIPQAVGYSTEVPLTFQAEAFDNASMHNTFTPPASSASQSGCSPSQSVSRLTAPRTGTYQVSAGVIWNGSVCSGNTVSGTAQLILKKNAAEYLAAQQSPTSPEPNDTIQNVSALTRLNQGDYVEAYVWQNFCAASGILLDVPSDGRNFVAMNWVGP